MTKILNALFNLTASANPAVRQLLWIGAALTAIWDYITDLWEDLFARIDAIILPILPGSIDFQPLGLINYIFPLDTVLTMVTALVLLMLLCAAIRIVKAFIPGIS